VIVTLEPGDAVVGATAIRGTTESDAEAVTLFAPAATIESVPLTALGTVKGMST